MEWRCAKSGDCCKGGVVLMTQAEADRVTAAAPADVELRWAAHPDPRFVGLLGDPACPMLGADNLCRIHKSRPYNCRRFACLREPGEAFEPGGPLGCQNAARRMETRDARRFLTVYQRPAIRWARRHGWDESMQ
jgi:Fe-S-cluster containining protein